MKRERSLHKDILVRIFAYLFHYELLEVSLVCKLWKESAQDARVWTQLYNYYSHHVWGIHRMPSNNPHALPLAPADPLNSSPISDTSLASSPSDASDIAFGSSPDASSSPADIASSPTYTLLHSNSPPASTSLTHASSSYNIPKSVSSPGLPRSASSPALSSRSKPLNIPVLTGFQEKQNLFKKRREKKSPKSIKSPMKTRRLSFSLFSRSNSGTFGDLSRQWSTLGGFRQDHSTLITAEEVAKGASRGGTGPMVDLKKLWKSSHLKDLVRLGIPDVHRPGVWTNMVGIKEVQHHSPDLYQITLRAMFGLHPPAKFYKVPHFGGPSFDLLSDSHELSPEGNICAQRILVVLAMENPDIQFCPTLPDLVQLFLRYLTESEAYIASKLLLKRSAYLTASRKESSATQYFAGSFKGTLASCRVFELLVKQHIPRLYASLKTREMSIGVMLYHKWFNRLFVDVVPMKTVLRIFDSYLLDGLKGIFRIGLAILKYCEEDLINARNSQEFSAILSEFHYFGLEDSVFDVAHAIPLRRAALVSRYQQCYAKLGAIKEPHAHVYYHPKNLQCSNIIAEDEFEMLWSWLPSSLRIRDPHLAFNSADHGCSLQYLLSTIHHHEFTLFIIRSTEDRIFGFFVSSPWSKERSHFFGNRESFVFTIRPSPDHFMWIPGHSNDRMQYVCDDGISVGAGPPAIVLHTDLSVTSHACPTFQSPPMGLMSNFDTLAVEVYSIS